jgi:hypothetical protein
MREKACYNKGGNKKTSTPSTPPAAPDGIPTFFPPSKGKTIPQTLTAPSCQWRKWNKGYRRAAPYCSGKKITGLKGHPQGKRLGASVRSTGHVVLNRSPWRQFIQDHAETDLHLLGKTYWKQHNRPDTVAHVYNHSYSGGRAQEDQGSKSALAKS